MPAQQGNVGGVLKKLGNVVAKAIAENKDNETSYGIQNLPPGIQNGIARLTECKFDVYKTGQNQGQPYFRASGVVVSPDVVTLKDGSPMAVKGMYTSIMVGIAERKKGDGSTVTVSDCLDQVMNEMRKLGADTSKLKGPEDLERLAAALKQAAPFFKFSTSESKPRPGSTDTPRTWENWHGTKGLENYGQGGEDAGAGVQDDSGAADGSDDSAEGGSNADASDQGDVYRDDADVDSLGARADEGDDEAKTQLEGMAAKAGVSKKRLDAAPTWADVVELIKGGSGDGGKETVAAEGDDDTPPEVGNVFDYVAPAGKVPGKKGKAKVECEVTKVNAKTETVSLRWVNDKKVTFNDVPWAELLGD